MAWEVCGPLWVRWRAQPMSFQSWVSQPEWNPIARVVGSRHPLFHFHSCSPWFCPLYAEGKVHAHVEMTFKFLHTSEPQKRRVTLQHVLFYNCYKWKRCVILSFYLVIHHGKILSYITSVFFLIWNLWPPFQTKQLLNWRWYAIINSNHPNCPKKIDVQIVFNQISWIKTWRFAYRRFIGLSSPKSCM